MRKRNNKKRKEIINRQSNENTILLLEGQITMGGRNVDIKLFRVEGGDSKYDEWDHKPYLVNESQMDVHRGEINMGKDLEEILFRINMYKNEIHKIKDVNENSNF